MSKGLSLHIGVNRLKPGFYSSSGTLRSPENDARAMAALALMEGYEQPRLLTNEKATKSKFLELFDRSLSELDCGDSFLISFSGHGGQIEDLDGDEKDGKDETWCFYDECLIDDEIGDRWKSFKAGVRIIVVSASCHSATAVKVWGKNCFRGDVFSSGNTCEKEIIINDQTILSAHLHDPDIKADILHLSACQDHQRASAGTHFSRFTELLLKYWDYGRFRGSYQELVYSIRKETGYLQRPGIKTLGSNHPFLQNKPAFKLY